MERSRVEPVSVDIVIPVWNEEGVLGLLFDRMGAVFSRAVRERLGILQVRYLIVDDGSTDNSAKVTHDAIVRGVPAVLIRLSRNFGHQNAVSAGLAQSKAGVVVVMDADLQDPPEVIPRLIEKWRDGFDVVYGQRGRRKGNVLKRLGYWAFYRIVALLADIPFPLDSGDFGLMDRRVVDALCRLPETLRFVRGLRAWVGFRQTGVAYDRPEREAGSSKYTVWRLYQLATHGVVSASVRPLQLAQVFSVSYLVLIGLLGVVVVFQRAIGPWLSVQKLVAIGFFLLLFGNLVQVFCIYILGAYVGRTYLEAKGRPPYVVMEIVQAADDGQHAGSNALEPPA